mgnify:CR=1 FL=1
MANIKSAKKRILVTETKTARNKAIRSEVKTSIKKVEAAVAAKDKAAAEAAYKDASSVIESACSKVYITRTTQLVKFPFSKISKRNRLRSEYYKRRRTASTVMLAVFFVYKYVGE